MPLELVTQETWIHFENGYYFSNLGRVRSRHNKIIVGVKDTKGYLRTYVGRPERTRVGVHVAVCLLFNGPKPSPLHEVAHNNGDKTDNRASNLRWATSKENSADRKNHGSSWGAMVTPTRKLTEQQVEEIKKELTQYKYGMLSALGRKYGVAPQTIHSIREGKIWSAPS